MEILSCTRGINETLCGFYGRNILNENQIDVWFQKLGWLDARDFEAACEQITNCEKSFPTPQVIFKYADEARQRRQTRENNADKKQAENFRNPDTHRNQIAKDCVKFIEDMDKFRGGKLAKLEFEANSYKDFVKKYPGVGFEDNYRDAIKRFKEELAKLDQAKPRAA